MRTGNSREGDDRPLGVGQIHGVKFYTEHIAAGHLHRSDMTGLTSWVGVALEETGHQARGQRCAGLERRHGGQQARPPLGQALRNR